MNDVAGAEGAQGAPAPVAARRSTRYRVTNRRLRFRTMVPILAALLLLLGICATAAYLGISSERQAAAAAHDAAIGGAAEAMRDAVLDAEARRRHFLFTRSADDMAGIAAAIALIDPALDRLDGLVQGDPARMAMARTIRVHLDGWQSELRQGIASARGAQGGAARAAGDTNLGGAANDDIRRLIGALQSNVGAARRGAESRQSLSFALLMGAVALAAMAAILMASVAMREVRRHLRLLHKRESQLDLLVASLEARVTRRTRALADANQRFQIALESSGVTVFSQDKDLVYQWVSQAFRGFSPEQIIGRRDADITPQETAAQLDRLKRGVVQSCMPARSEVRIDSPPDTLWYDVTVVPVIDAHGTLTGVIGGAVDITERRQFEGHVRLLMRELTHRSKNLLAVTQALMRQTAASATSIEDFSGRFAARLESLAGSYDLLIKDDWRGTTMEELVKSQLAHHADKLESQIEIEGALLRVPPDATQNIGMALHELATNAAKYGALAVPDGHVHVSWDVSPGSDGVPQCRISWIESGGPPVSPPAHRGFGQVVIERTVARAVGGTVTLDYKPTGLEWTLVFPVRD